MKGATSVLRIWVLSVPLIVLAQSLSVDVSDGVPNVLSILDGIGLERGSDIQAATDSLVSSSSIRPTSPSPSSSIPPTRTSTLSIIHPTESSDVEPSSSSASISASISPPLATSAISTTSNDGLGSASQSSAPVVPESSGMSSQRRTLIIVLSTVLGSVGIILIVAAVLLLCRYRKGKAPFHHRGVTPINDDEIESWRGNAEQKQQSPKVEPGSPHTTRGVSIDSIALKHSPGWNWSPTAIHSLNSPGNLPEPPSFVARAPNSRVGLTDEAIPGEDAFIPPMKRQSSRLSKAPPGHSRTKSRRSSISAKSVRSTRSYNGGFTGDTRSRDRIPTWYDPDAESVGTGLRDTDSPVTSIFDGLTAGGLSPRPKSKSQLRPSPWDQSEEIGRAIA